MRQRQASLHGQMNPKKRNLKEYLAVPAPRFVPDPKRLFRKLHLKETVRIFHPITGKEIIYRHGK